MGKEKNNRKNKRQQQARKNKARSQWVNGGNYSSEFHKDNPLFQALIAGTVGTFTEGCMENAPQVAGIATAGETPYAFFYGKDYSIPNRDFIGQTYEFEGDFYLATWTELLHPSTAIGGLWVNRKYDHRPTADDFNEFLHEAHYVIGQKIYDQFQWFFYPLWEYNMRLLGMDQKPAEYFTVENATNEFVGILNDLKTDQISTTTIHHV